MPPPRYRDLSKGSTLEATYTDALEDVLSGYEARALNVTISSPTSIQVVAGGDVGSVGASINGEWRHIEATQSRSHPGGAAGTYDVYLVASANSFAAGPPDVGEIDNTFYGFEIRIVPGGDPAPTGTLTGGQTIANTRKIRTLEWSGTVITRVDRLSPETPAAHASTHVPGGSDPMPADAAAGVASLRTLGVGATQAAAGNDPRLSDSRAPSGAAGGDLTGTYPNPTIKADVNLSGAPTAATPAQDSGGTRLATAGYVLGQAASATPLVDGTAAVGTSLRWARGDHRHPTDTSRAPLDNPAFTTKTTAPYVGVGTGGWLGSSTPDNVSLYSNYSPVLTSWTDVTKPSWAASVGNASDRFVVFRAPPASTGFAEVMALTAAGALTVASLSGTPNFTGAATGQTAAPGDNTTKLATTAFVLANGASLSNAVPLMAGAAAAGTASSAARGDHRHPTDTSRAPLDAPTFTGAARAVTQGSGDNSTLLATTAYVKSQGYATTGFVTGQGYVVGGSHVSFSDVDVSGAIDATNIKSFGATRFFSDALRTYVYDAAGVERLRVSGSGVLVNQAPHYLGYTGWTFLINPGSGAQRNARYDNALGSVANILATLISDLKDTGILG